LSSISIKLWQAGLPINFVTSTKQTDLLKVFLVALLDGLIIDLCLRRPHRRKAWSQDLLMLTPELLVSIHSWIKV